MKRQSLHVKDNVIYDHFTKQQVIWTHGYGATDRYVTRNEWGALLLQWPVPTNFDKNIQLKRQSWINVVKTKLGRCNSKKIKVYFRGLV